MSVESAPQQTLIETPPIIPPSLEVSEYEASGGESQLSPDFQRALGGLATQLATGNEIAQLPITTSARQDRKLEKTIHRAERIAYKKKQAAKAQEMFKDTAVYKPSIFKTARSRKQMREAALQDYRNGVIKKEELLKRQADIRKHVSWQATGAPKRAQFRVGVSEKTMDWQLKQPVRTAFKDARFPSIDIGRGIIWDREKKSEEEKLMSKAKKLGTSALLAANLRFGSPSKKQATTPKEQPVVASPIIETFSSPITLPTAESPLSVNSPATPDTTETATHIASTLENEVAITPELKPHTAAVHAEITDRIKSALENIKQQLGDAYNEEAALAQVTPLVMAEYMDRITEAYEKDSGAAPDFDPSAVLSRLGIAANPTTETVSSKPAPQKKKQPAQKKKWKTVALEDLAKELNPTAPKEESTETEEERKKRIKYEEDNRQLDRLRNIIND